MCCYAISCQHSTLNRLFGSWFGCVFLVWRHHFRIIGAHFPTFFSTIFLFLTFLNIHIYFIILKTCDQQFTLTTKKSLHIIFKSIKGITWTRHHFLNSGAIPCCTATNKQEIAEFAFSYWSGCWCCYTDSSISRNVQISTVSICQLWCKTWLNLTWSSELHLWPLTLHYDLPMILYLRTHSDMYAGQLSVVTMTTHVKVVPLLCCCCSAWSSAYSHSPHWSLLSCWFTA